MNPMFLMMGLSLVMLVIMPKMMENMGKLEICNQERMKKERR
jgi:hypothetical protein